MIADPPTTKADVWRYYHAMAEHVLPGIAGRPLSVIRCPSGAEGACFFQRHLMNGMPKAVRPVMAQGSEGEEEYFAVDDLEGLLALVQFGAIELHPWGARADRLDRPDRLVFDLDPAEGLAWDRVIAAALELRERLVALGLESFPRTTGGKGLHVVVPIERRHGLASSQAICGRSGQGHGRGQPRTLHRQAGQDRPDKGASSSTICAMRTGPPLSPRTRCARAPGATVAMPVSWAEVSETLDPRLFTLTSVPGRSGRVAILGPAWPSCTSACPAAIRQARFPRLTDLRAHVRLAFAAAYSTLIP